MINNIGNRGAGLPLEAMSRAERAERVDRALDTHRVGLAQMSPQQLAENREYGHRLIDDVQAARGLQPASGQSESDFTVLQARLTAGL